MRPHQARVFAVQPAADAATDDEHRGRDAVVRSGTAVLGEPAPELSVVALGLCFVLTPVWSAWIGVLALPSQPPGTHITDIGPPPESP